MLRPLLVLAWLGALEAAAVSAPRAPEVDVVVPVPPHPKADAVLADTKALEPTLITLPVTNILTNGQRFFVVEMSVGTPPQGMSVAVDVNSRLSYVASVNCTDPYCLNHRRYDSSASATYVEDGTPFELPNGQNASGVLVKDAIGVAGVTVQGQTFGEATAVWNSYTVTAPNDGTLGLGFGASEPEGVPSILDTMAEQGLIAERLAGLWLGRDPSGGELTLGGLNGDRYSGELAWASTLLNPDGWVVTADSAAVGETQLCSDHCHVSALTNSPYFFMSMETAKTVNAALGGMDIGQPGVAALECTTLYQLPTLKLEMAGRTMEMSPLEYTFIAPFGDGVEMCLSGFVGLPDLEDNVIMVGNMFMQKFYMAYDMDKKRVGFAESTQ